MHTDTEMKPQRPEKKQELTEKALENLALQLSAAERNLQSSSSGPSSVAGSEERDTLLAHPDGTRGRRRSGSLQGSNGDGSSRGHLSSKSSGEKGQGESAPAALEPGSVEMHTSASRSSSSVDRKSAGIKSVETGSSGDQQKTEPSVSAETGKGGSKGGSSSSSGTGHGFDWSEVLAHLREEMRVEVAQRSQADADVATLRLAMEKMVARHKIGMNDIWKKLSVTSSQSAGDECKIADLLQQIAVMNEEHDELLVEKRAARKAGKNRRKNDSDDVYWLRAQKVQLAAEQEQRIFNIQKQIKDEKNSALQDKIATKVVADKAQGKTDEHCSVLKEELAASELAEVANEKDRAEVQSLIDSMAVDHAAELKELNDSLNATWRQLKLRDEIDEAAVDDGGRGGRLVEASAMLAASRQEQRTMALELRDLRLELLGVRQEKSKEVGDMQSLIDVANKNLEAKEVAGAGGSRSPLVKAKNAGRGRKPVPVMGTLTSIEEESDDESSIDGSFSASGIVSSDGADVVAELADFDDFDPSASTNALLRSELADERLAHTKLKEMIAGGSGGSDERIRLLKEALQQSENERDKAGEELLAHQLESRDDADKNAAQNTALQVQIDESEQKSRDLEENQVIDQRFKADIIFSSMRKEIENENLKQQINFAVEAKKNADLRLEDLKREVESSKRRQMAIETTLQRELLVAQAQQFAAEGGDRSDAVSGLIETETQAIQELKLELSSRNENRTVMAYNVESKEMEWKGNVQSMEASHANALAELEREFEENKQLIEREQNDLIRDLQDRLDKANQELSNLKAPRPTGSSKSQASSVSPNPPQAPQTSHWLLRCPSRVSNEPSPPLPGGVVGAPCRYVLWRVVGLVNNSIALLCNSVGFEILEASKRACSIWGSASLHGHSLMSLVQSPMRAEWMKSKIEAANPGTGPVPGFMVKDLQCMELQSKKGTFDASVVVAHLPDEPGKPPGMLAIFEQLSTPAGEKEQQHGRGSRLSRRSGYSPAQSMASSAVSVSPSDSVSCIAEKLFGK